MAVNVETALDKMSSSGSVYVDRIFIMNRLHFVWCVYHTSGRKLLIYIVLAN